LELHLQVALAAIRIVGKNIELKNRKQKKRSGCELDCMHNNDCLQMFVCKFHAREAARQKKTPDNRTSTFNFCKDTRAHTRIHTHIQCSPVPLSKPQTAFAQTAQKQKVKKQKTEHNGTIQISKRRGGSGEEVEADGRTFSVFRVVWHLVRSPLRSSHEVARCVVTKNNEAKVP